MYVETSQLHSATLSNQAVVPTGLPTGLPSGFPTGFPSFPGGRKPFHLHTIVPSKALTLCSWPYRRLPHWLTKLH